MIGSPTTDILTATELRLFAAAFRRESNGEIPSEGLLIFLGDQSFRDNELLYITDMQAMRTYSETKY